MKGLGNVGTYHPGDYFGEEALLQGKSRGATIVAVTDLHLLRLTVEDFESTKATLRERMVAHFGQSIRRHSFTVPL